MNKQEVVIILIAFMCGVLAIKGENRWVWSKGSDNNQAARPFLGDKSAKYESNALRRNSKAREREPTTRRPLPGQPQNEEIDDYADDDVNTNVGTRNFPFPSLNNGNFFGTNNYPNALGAGYLGGNGNGILVGPGGPTGIIGRPQTQYPSGFPGSTGFIGQPGFGFTGIPGAYGGGIGGQLGFGGGSGYLGIDASSNPGFGGQFGGNYPIVGQYPGGATGAQYPVGQFPTHQFPPHYHGGGPAYTEGYGLAANGAGYPGFLQHPAQFGYIATRSGNENVNRKLNVEGKEAAVAESSKIREQQLDDKINKSLTKVPN